MTLPVTVRPRRAHALLALAGAGALLALTACSTTSVLNLEVGQCLNDASGDSVSSVTVIDCGQPHQNEIYALPQLPDGDFPGVEAVNAQAEELCSGQAFTDFVGVPYAQSEIYLSSLSPSQDTWSDGDREIVCLLRNQDGSPITGSLRGANR